MDLTTIPEARRILLVVSHFNMSVLATEIDNVFGAVRTCFDHVLSKFSGFSWERILFLNSACVNMGRFPFSQNFGISGSAVNGTRFVGSSHWKISRKSGKSKKVVPFSRLEFPNGMSCSIYVSRSLYQFQVQGRAPPRTAVYDQMEQLFTNRKFHFCYHRNFRVFFLNGKRPW